MFNLSESELSVFSKIIDDTLKCFIDSLESSSLSELTEVSYSIYVLSKFNLILKEKGNTATNEIAFS